MDQFRQIGEVLGSLKALMVLKDDIPINQRQCCLLLDIFTLAFETISEEIKRNLRLEEKNIKWKALEHPMRELHRIFKEGEFYIKSCLEIKDWWGKAISLHRSNECVEFHIHNLLCCFPIVIEAIETAGEISGLDSDVMQKRRLILTKKYEGNVNWVDPKIFNWNHGKQYLVTREICNRFDSVWKEDKWLLLETIRERKSLVPTTLAKHEQRLGDFLLKKLNGSEQSNDKLLPSWVLIGAKDYHVKRRLGSGSHFKEIHWLGESFAMRHFFGEIEPLNDEISLAMSLSHPNIMQFLCGFHDEEKKEGFILMELMNKNLSTYIKENCSQRKRIPFSLAVAVDIMLQIARGMEYLHSKKVYHGDLNPSNVLIKTRNSSIDGYFYAKITGFSLNSIKNYTSRSSSNQTGTTNQVIWHAPEVLAEQEQSNCKCSSKYTEKADVYSFGMVCFQLLTGKIPFEDAHLQEDKMGKNIRAGERPLFPFNTPKYLANLTKKCWQTDPNYRPSFSAISRILRYIKKCLVINPDHGQPESPPPLVDFCDIEAGYSKKFLGDGSPCLAPVSQIPFQMFGYRLIEKEKTSGSFKEKGWDFGNEATFTRPTSICGDENGFGTEDPFFAAIDQRSVYSEVQASKIFSRKGMDQRSVCSEAPVVLRKIFSTTTMDQRSFHSDFPGRKMDLGLETPERKFQLRSESDQMSPGSQTQERSNFLATEIDQISVGSEVPEKKDSGIVADQKSVCSETIERKISTSSFDKKSVSSEVAEKKVLSRTVSDQKSVSSETPEKRDLTRTRSYQKSVFPHIPEKKVLSPVKCDQSSIRSEIQEKKIVAKKVSERRSVRSEVPERKVVTRKKLTDAKIIKNSGTQKWNSPRSSPTRIPKTDSPKSSPRSSPLNPCLRCSRLNTENQTSSNMSPSRHRRDYVSDSNSEMA